MTAGQSPELPARLAALLDDASSEAKRRGHSRVTPAHVAVVLSARGGEAAGAFAPETSRAVESFLSSLPRTFDKPVVDDETLAMLRDCAPGTDPLSSLVEALNTHALALEPIGTWSAVVASPEGPTPSTVQEESGSVIPASSPNFALPDRYSAFAAVVSTESPAVPRPDVVRRVMSLLTARDPQTPLLVAPEGQGRTGLAQCLAAVLAGPECGGSLAGWPVVRIRPEGVLLEGQWDSVKQVFSACRGSAVVFIDDVEVLCALGGGGAYSGMLSILRSALHDPRLRVVMTVSGEFVDRFQASDRELFDELDRVDLPPLTDGEILAIARKAAGELEAFHGVRIDAEVVAAAVAPPRQIDSKGHPALAVARLDRAAAAAAMGDKVTAVADLGTPVGGQMYLSFDPDGVSSRLKRVVLGQDVAIDNVTNRLALTRASLDTRPERPDGVFLLAGPTGTGKTQLALSLAEEVFGTQDALIRLDMSEFSHDHTVSKLIGSPPGYVGSTEPESWLTTKIRRRPQSILLLDEVEKAHPIIWNTFLQVFDAGRLTDSQGRVADFRDVIVIMTTNMGAAAFEERKVLGFNPTADSEGADEKQVRAEIKQWMRPELLNRLDQVLVFRPLSPETVRQIVTNQVRNALQRLNDRGWIVEYDDEVIDVLCAKGYSKEYGARPLLRALEENLLGKVGRLPAGRVTVEVVEGTITATSGEAAPA